MGKPSANFHNWAGEFSSINPADAPQGAAERLTNCAIRDQDKIEPLRGFDLLVGANPGFTSLAPDASNTQTAGVVDPTTFLFSAPTPGSALPLSLPNLSTAIFTLDNNGLFTKPLFVNLLSGYDLGLTNPSGDFASSTITMLKTAYLNTSRGLFKLDTPNPAPAGRALIRPTQLNPLPVTNEVAVNVNNISSYAISNAAAFGDARDWLPPNYTVAYRLVVGVKDPQGYIRYSEPSGRILATNTQGTNRHINLLIWPGLSIPPSPSGLAAKESVPFVQIFRSQSMPPDAAGGAQNPSDEMFLVSELVPPAYTAGIANWGYTPTVGTAATFTAGHTYTDVSPDSQIFVPLYTNRGLGNGIQSAKTNAPASNVLFSFGGRAYYGDVVNQQALLLFMSGVSASGLQPGATITISGVTFTAVSSLQDDANRTFFVFSAGTPSANLRNTCLSLCDAINYYYLFANSATPYDQKVTADYLSLGNGDEGQILLRRPVPGSPAFTVRTSSTAGWAQDYTTAAVNSDPSASPGGLQWSDLNQPDSVPLANQVVLGAPQDRVVAGVALRDYAIVFKEDGAWTVRESPRGPSFAPLDTTIKLVSPRCAVALDNECVALTSQGVVSIGEYGVTNLSIPIQRELLTILADNIGLFKGAFAVGYETEKEYWLFMPTGRTSTTADLIKIYNKKTSAWTTGDFGTLTAAIEAPTSSSSARQPSTALHLATIGWGSGGTLNPFIVRELKSYTNSDYRLSSVTPIWSAGVNQFNGTFTTTTVNSPVAYSAIISVGSLLRLVTGSLVQNTFLITDVSLSADQTTLTITCRMDSPTQTPPSFGDLTGAAVQPALVSTIRQLPQTAGDPLVEKLWDGAGCYMWHRYMNTPILGVSWETEKTQYPILQQEPGPQAQPWAYDIWSKGPWMRGAQDYLLNPTIDNVNCRGGQLTQTLSYYNCQSRFELTAIDFYVGSSSDRVVR